jgi:hypothetical protein
MYLLRLSSLIFALGLLVSKLFAMSETPAKQSWDHSNSATRTYQVQPFTKLYIEGTFKVVLEQGDRYGLQIKTDEDNFKYIDVQSNSETLSLKIIKKYFNFDDFELHITFKEIETLTIEGGIRLETLGYVDLKDFYLHVEGGALVNMNVKANRLKVFGQGGVKFELNGIADEFDASVSGAGYINASGLKTRSCDFRIEGVGAGSVFSTGSLHATISGVGKIRYKGGPQVYKNIEGIGVVSPD